MSKQKAEYTARAALTEDQLDLVSGGVTVRDFDPNNPLCPEPPPPPTTSAPHNPNAPIWK